MSNYAGTHPRGDRPHPHLRHAVRRAKSRYGIGLSTVQRLEQSVLDKQGILRSVRQTSSRLLHEIELDGNVYYAIYSKSTNHLVTLLPVGRGKALFGDEGPKCVCGAWLITVSGRQECPIHQQELLEARWENKLAT